VLLLLVLLPLNFLIVVRHDFADFKRHLVWRWPHCNVCQPQDLHPVFCPHGACQDSPQR
jgi:hypothetical protein